MTKGGKLSTKLFGRRHTLARSRGPQSALDNCGQNLPVGERSAALTEEKPQLAMLRLQFISCGFYVTGGAWLVGLQARATAVAAYV
jgi:hypothetical protein